MNDAWNWPVWLDLGGEEGSWVCGLCEETNVHSCPGMDKIGSGIINVVVSMLMIVRHEIRSQNCPECQIRNRQSSLELSKMSELSFGLLTCWYLNKGWSPVYAWTPPRGVRDVRGKATDTNKECSKRIRNWGPKKDHSKVPKRTSRFLWLCVQEQRRGRKEKGCSGMASAHHGQVK